jgi:uncharacterized membrane protein HdeD (DUF308 family)
MFSCKRRLKMVIKKEKESCGCTMCGGMKAHGVMKIVLGLLVLANAQWAMLTWPQFIGVLIVLMGIAKLMHKCK